MKASDSENILVKKLKIPNFFSMNIVSEYTRLAAQMICADGWDGQISCVGDKIPVPVVCAEIIEFETIKGKIPVTVDLSKNLYFLRACRKIDAFKFGYEPAIHGAIDTLTGADAVIFDIGANWGATTLQLALRSNFSGGKIFAFETQPQAVRVGRNIVKRLSLGDQVTFFDTPLSAFAQASGQTAAVVRLDDLSLPQPQVIKIDVDAGVQEILAGAVRLLVQTKPIVILNGRGSEQSVDLRPLADLGYHFYQPGWYSPFLKEFSDCPPFLADIQMFALAGLDLGEVSTFERMTVLASPQRLTAL